MPPNMRWLTTGGEVVPPVGLIVGLNIGASVPDNWTAFTDADGYFLKGTDSDVEVGTTGSASALSLTTASGGGHSSGTTANIARIGYGSSGTSYTTSRDTSSQGSHSGHSISFNYTPAKSSLKLVQAGADAKFVEDLIMFSFDARSKHTAFSSFDGTDGLLAADTATQTVAAVKTANTTGSVSNSHDHIRTYTSDGLGILADLPTAIGSGGGSHTHTGGTPTITPSHQKALMRAWALSGAEEMEGMIGMWVGAGVPDGWEIVSELTGHYASCESDGAGTQEGNNTLAISGTTGNTGHSHSTSGFWSGNVIYSPLLHTNSVTHSHSYSDSAKAYEPARFFIKFIKYVG